MKILCPKCGQEAVTLRVTYIDARGHEWQDVINRPGEVPTLDTPPPQREGLRMPFGKHKGILLDDLPIDYIKWCLENIDNLRDNLREEMQNQVILKSGGGVVRQEVKRVGTKFIFGPKK